MTARKLRTAAPEAEAYDESLLYSDQRQAIAAKPWHTKNLSQLPVSYLVGALVAAAALFGTSYISSKDECATRLETSYNTINRLIDDRATDKAQAASYTSYSLEANAKRGVSK